jgi:hypothetical protein
VGTHELNQDSSRSHSILTVYVEATATQGQGQGQGGQDKAAALTRYGKVCFVDLAVSLVFRPAPSAGHLLEVCDVQASVLRLHVCREARI